MHQRIDGDVPNQSVFSFTDYLNHQSRSEMDLLHQFRLKFPQSQKQKQDMETTPFRQIEKQGTFLGPEGSYSTTVPKNCCIDKRALVVNGRLVYLHDDSEGVAQDRRQLLQQLKANKIGYRQYILGKKQKFMSQMSENYKRKEQQTIGEYIRKHINIQKTTKIQFADNFDVSKQQLFCGK